MDWFKKILENIRTMWGKWTVLQKVILFSVIATVIIGLVLVVSFSGAPAMTPLLTSPVSDPEDVARITNRLDEEGVKNNVTGGIIYVEDENQARKMRNLLIREDLVPDQTDPWALFDMERWTITDYERDVNLRRALTQNLEQHIGALDEVDSAQVTLVIPEKALFSTEQQPASASVIISPKPGSDISENRYKIEGIVKLIRFAVEGLSEENIVITDIYGKQLNNFMDFQDFDRLELTKRMLREKQVLEAQYMGQILQEMKGIFSDKRVRIINMDIDLEFVNKSVETEEHYPIEMTPEDPSTPYPDRQVTESFILSQSNTNKEFNGTGFNPEGPPGQEGQTPPQYQDLTNLVGNYNEDSDMTNYVVNTRQISEDSSPYQIARISVAVALDGIWKTTRNEKGEYIFENGSLVREYIPVSDEDIRKAQTLVEHAVGFDSNRGDSVTVQHIPFDRTEEHRLQDEEYLKRQQLQRSLFYSIIALVGVIMAFVVFRLISKEMERRRRIREEELARQHQAMREQALRNAEEEGVEVEMSVNERARLEMQENAMNLAREHPKDVAKLIRTWLSEE
ncbi:MAG: flagellar basal-body MS-ring/collar protein FliF [Spirochaetaceae bacterium]|jgi:flagellar M-ring protein FliF|nr:flagellar basal-body MS-ring/collar protein FliF [Spirochaetaceae bacterium]